MNNQHHKNTAAQPGKDEDQQIGANGNEDKEYVKQFNEGNVPAHKNDRKEKDAQPECPTDSNKQKGKEDELRDQRLGGSERGGGTGSA